MTRTPAPGPRWQGNRLPQDNLMAMRDETTYSCIHAAFCLLIRCYDGADDQKW